MGHRFMLTARFLQDVVDVVRESGDIIRRQWEKTHAVRHKGSIDLVTETDVAVEAFLKERLGELLPQAEFLAEESCVAAPVLDHRSRGRHHQFRAPNPPGGDVRGPVGGRPCGAGRGERAHDG